MKAKYLCFSLTFFLWSLVGSTQKLIHNYIAKYKHIAIERMKSDGIPASVIMGISIVESGAGSSPVCKKLKNHFGIVGKNTNSVAKLGYKSKYKEYKTDAESYMHFSQVVQRKKFYKKLKGNKDYKEWIIALDKANYSSAKQKWVNKIIQTIAKYKLYELDKA